MKLGQFIRTSYFHVINLRIIPLEIVEVATASLQDWIVECITVAILVGILRVNHPATASCESGSLLRLTLGTGMSLRKCHNIESWSSDVKMSFVVRASSITWRTKVSTLQHQCCSRIGVGRVSSNLPTFATPGSHPIPSTQCFRNGSCSIICCSKNIA